MKYEEFLKISETLSNPLVEEWKKHKKKIIGYYCTYVPEEILVAADILGFRMRGTGAEGTSRADTILSRFNCSYVRASLDLALEGKYNFLDGLIAMNSCDHARRMYDIFKYKVVGNVLPENFPLFFLSVPHILTERGFNWLLEEFNIFITELENHFNITITKDDLNRGIQILNENRKLLKEIHGLRALDKPKISGVDILKINVANSAIPKEIANQELSKILTNVKDNNSNSNYRARVLLTGSLIDNPMFVKIIEDVGGAVVSDMLCFGTRNFWDLTEEGGKPIENITKRYYYKISCPRMMDDHKRRFEFLKERIEKDKVDGVIGTRIEFCDLNGVENALYEHELENLNIPMLTLDRDYFLGDIGRYKTRIEAFVEQIE
jgi:benzoyl-CoA reductase subunit C